jgi:hypothetical protein
VSFGISTELSYLYRWFGEDRSADISCRSASLPLLSRHFSRSQRHAQDLLGLLHPSFEVLGQPGDCESRYLAASSSRVNLADHGYGPCPCFSPTSQKAPSFQVSQSQEYHMKLVPFTKTTDSRITFIRDPATNLILR